MDLLTHILLLLGVAVGVVILCQRLHVPTSLGYLLVGFMLGPHTVGPTVEVPQLHALAEFGVVFLLFTIGLNYSLPQLNALRHQVLGLGAGQVVATTAVVALGGWLAGLPFAIAFVLGAVCAQSSTTIIANLLGEQGEQNRHHGRIGVAMSVFQDVTAVPFLVVIPVLGAGVVASALAVALAMALAKAMLALALVFVAGRWLLRPLFRAVSERRSVELFTLTVLLVALLAAWTTNSLGLSLAFGAFLAGMMLGETEFRHQVESSIRPFRDVLLGMFFIGIGMRFDPVAVWPVLHWVLLGAGVILGSKTILVTLLVRRAGFDARDALRTGLVLAVGGEFGLALIAIALDASVLDARMGQIAIASVLLAMIGGALLIRFNHAIAAALVRVAPEPERERPQLRTGTEGQVVIAGYGRVGHVIAVLLRSSSVPFIVFDADPRRVAQGRADGFEAYLGDISDPALLTGLHLERADLLAITVNDMDTALAAIAWVRAHCPQVPIIARARDLETSSRLIEAGATHAYPEIVEASLRLGATALEILRVPNENIDAVLQGVRDWDYRPVLENPEAEPGTTTR
jgi:CPA2 family monovalent cation:H+ antiporter-2